jgi:hypothetical protein
MPKVEIDYSNTIFYKIFCKDSTIKELYVGLTTNFVQRRHAHKQSCKNKKATNYNCKLYNAIRNAGGWDNWQMEIIAFHNCEDSHEAHKKEQEYFETLGATLNSIEPLPKPKIKIPVAKNIKEKTILFCEPCNIYFSYWKAQETHNNTQKHHKMVEMNNANKSQMTTKIKINPAQQYFCESCDYTTCKKSNYDQHILTRKHCMTTSGLHNPSTLIMCDCGKSFSCRQNIHRHKKKCSVVNQLDEPISHPPTIQPSHSSTDDMQMTLILELVKQNQEFKNLLLQQSNQMMEQNKTMIEVAKNSNVNHNTISNSNNHSNNKTFNLQFFLNETCKDAMNMKEFIQSLELSLPELEKMGEVGFAEGMSRVFINRLNSLDITKRPIHCSDVKREIIHIKDDNKWERDNANLDRLRKIIKQLTHKNILRVDDWKKANPGCTEYNSRKNDQYLRINMEAIGPVDDDDVKRDFGKIIRRVAENTAIDKKYL